MAWPALGFYGSGWEGVIIDSGVKGGVYEFTVEFTKDDREPVRRTFQIGRYTRELRGHGQSAEKGNTRVVLNISDRLGLYGISELVQKPLDYDWEANKGDLPGLSGYRIGMTNSNGQIAFRCRSLWPPPQVLQGAAGCQTRLRSPQHKNVVDP